MARRPKNSPDNPARAIATANRFDGGQVQIVLVMQPQDAAKLADELVRALLPKRD